MASIPRNQSSGQELTNTKYSCSICLELLRDKRISFSHNGSNGWQRLTDLTIQNCAIFHPDQDLPRHDSKDLCTFCAHLRVDHLMVLSEAHLMEFQFPFQYRTGKYSTGIWAVVVEVRLGRISDVQARKDHCFLCHSVAEIATREGLSDESDQVIMKARAEHSIELFVMDAEDRLWQVAKFKHDYSEILGFRNYHREKAGGIVQDFAFNPHVQGLIDWESVQSWIESSLSEKLILSKPPSEFRVIDVQDQCVVRMARPCEYICLSYVWGSDTSFQATFQTISDLEKPQSLASPDLPRTIRHAMIACAALGKRYLWVDRLCILQDEENNPSKSIQIEAMADIYGSAYLTLVALEGDSASYGLHGISPDLKRVALYEMWFGGELFYEEVPSMQSLSSKSIWQRRGWTYQEAILSPRLLIFTKYGLFYEHSNCNLQHDHSFKRRCKLVTDDFLPRVFSGWSEPQFLLPQSTAHDTLSAVGGAISQRTFGHEGDIVNGLIGILDVVCGKGNHRFGMPLEGIENTICWTLSSPGVPRQARGEAIFPSWSWASIKTKDPPDFDLHSRHNHNSVSIASWGFQDNSQPLGVRWLPPVTPSDIVKKRGYDNMKMFLWKYGCVYTGDPRFSQNKTMWTYAEFARHGLAAMLAFSKNGHDLNPSFTPEQTQAAHVDTSILCYSQTAILRLGDHSDSWFAFYYQNYRIGRLKFDTESEDATAREMVQSGSASLEVVALFVGWSFRKEDSKLDLDALWEDLNLTKLFHFEQWYESRTDEHSIYDVDVHVMAIRTTDGISRRLGVGKIPLLVWLKLLKPMFRSIWISA